MGLKFVFITSRDGKHYSCSSTPPYARLNVHGASALRFFSYAAIASACRKENAKEKTNAGKRVIVQINNATASNVQAQTLFDRGPIHPRTQTRKHAKTQVSVLFEGQNAYHSQRQNHANTNASIHHFEGQSKQTQSRLPSRGSSQCRRGHSPSSAYGKRQSQTTRQRRPKRA